jgi:hypothetical protein
MEPVRTPTTVLNNQRLQALAISISVVSILLLVALVLIWRRFQREKVKKQQVGFHAKKKVLSVQNVPESLIAFLTKQSKNFVTAFKIDDCLGL